MGIIASTEIAISVKDVTEWILWDLPQPTAIYYDKPPAGVLCWQISGYFGTEKGQAYLRDAIRRLELTINGNDAKEIGKPRGKARIERERVIKLRELVRHCKSLPGHDKPAQRADSYADYAFWAIKLWTEDEIRRQGEGLPISYDRLERWALSEFARKERSTIKAKCRSVWGWYESKEWRLPKGRRYEMTRQEHAKKIAKERAQRNREKVINTVTGLYADQYKKKSGAWHFGKISEATGVSSKTVAKILKDWEKHNKPHFSGVLSKSLLC